MDEQDILFRQDASVDSSSVIIEDFAGGKMIKIFPYLLPNTKRGIQFIQPNATTLAYYTQLGFDGELKTDKDGNLYFEVLGSQTTATELMQNAGANHFAEELSEIPTFSALTNYWPKKMVKSLKLGQFNLTPIVFSIEAPLSPEAWDTNIQPLFIAGNVIPAKDSESDLSYEIEQEGIYEVQFINLNSVTARYKNCSIQFTELNHQNIRDMSLVLPSNSLFGGVFGKTLINEKEEDFSLTEPKSYPIWNGSPISTENRLEMLMKWADTKLVLPIHIIDKFKTEQPLSKLFKDDADAWLTDGEALYFLMKDMILYTQMYVNGWNDIHAEDKLSDPNNSNYGTIKINVTLGTENAPATYQAGKKVVNLVVGKQPAEVIETLYESFLREHPTVDKGTLAIFKAAVVALSRYVRSGNLALGGGLNDFNSIYLPWRLKLGNKIAITRTTGSAGAVNYSLKDDPQVSFDSHWYEYDGANLVAKPIDNLYKTQLIQSERDITQPLIPAMLKEKNISSNPGGVSIDSESELSYNWLIPTQDAKVFDKLMLKDLTTTVTDPVDQVLNDRTARVTDAATVKLINEVNAALTGVTLANDWASETQAVKDILGKWYKDHIETQPGSGFWAGVANFLAAFGPLATIQKAEDTIITSSGYDKGELVSFGVTGADWIGDVSEPAEHVWRFMKVIRDGFDSTTFETVNHAEQWNGQQFSGYGMTSLTYPVENWLREIKGSWLNKYLTNEAGLRAYLFDQAVSLLTAFNHPSWDTRAHQVPEAKFLEFFPGLKGHMTFTQFELRLNGYIDVNYNGDREGWGEEQSGSHNFPGTGIQRVPLKFERAQAIIKLEIIEQIPIIFPNRVHYKLKAGVSQSFNLGQNRQLIFTKDEWHNLIRVIRPDSYYETIDLKPIKGEDFGEVKELEIFTLWASEMAININGTQILIDPINNFDETVVKQKVIFS